MSLIPVWFQRVLQCVGYAVLGVALLWSVGALWFFDPLPAPLPQTLAVLWVIVLLVLFFGWRIFGLRPVLARHCPWLPDWFTSGVPRTAAIVAAVAALVVIRAAWSLKQPSADRTWVPGQARDVVVRHGEDVVTIENVRNTTHHARGEADVKWETRDYDLDGIRTLDVIIEPFMEFEGISHFIMSFGFEDGEHLAVSVEARVEADERFGVLAALFKEFELVYVVGDERDLLWSRVAFEEHPVFVHPVRVREREQLRALFVLVLNHAAALAKRPRFYNTITNNCTNAQLRHVEYLSAIPFPWWDYRLIFPGFIDRFLHERGAIDNSMPLEELRESALINPRVRDPAGMTGPEWSRAIRANRGQSAILDSDRVVWRSGGTGSSPDHGRIRRIQQAGQGARIERRGTPPEQGQDLVQDYGGAVSEIPAVMQDDDVAGPRVAGDL